MSQQLEMTIIARDQASRVVNQVQKKVMDFGKDIGTSIAAVAGPMALATMAFSKISAHFEKMAQLRKEAFDWGASLSDSAAKLDVTVGQFQGIEAAADSTGKSVEDIAKAFKSVEQRIAEAKAGNAAAIESFKALGFTAEEIKTLKPEDVLARLGNALSSVQDPAKRAEIAITALGESAKGLQDVLAKGFDIAGAFQDREGLTDEEAAFLRETAKKERAKQNREKLGKAKETAADEFLKNDPEAAGVIAAARERIRNKTEGNAIGNRLGGVASLEKDVDVQNDIQAILARRAKEKEDAEKARIAASGGAAAAGNLDALAKERAEKAAKEKADKEAKEKADKERAAGLERQQRAAEARNKKEAEDFAKEVEKENERVAKEKEKAGSVATKSLEVSSLRAIGGAMAGENMGGAMDVQTEQLNTQKKMVEELSELNEFIRRQPTNFTLPGAGPTMIG